MEEKIAAFWKWFVENEQFIKESIENELAEDRAHVADQLNEFILDLGTFTWDIGLDDANAWFLTISPNGVSERHKVSQKIIHSAPKEMNWIFNSSRPAKMGEWKFTIFNSELDEISIDATNWEYIAFDEEDGRVELIIEAKNLLHLDEDTLETAGNVFVVRELGEFCKMQQISSVTLVKSVDQEYADSKTAIRHLRRDLGV